MQEQEQEEKSPILGSWKNVYGLVLGALLGMILFLYVFTRFFE